MDNRIFNINGEGDSMLEKVIELALMQRHQSLNPTASAWAFIPDKGLVLYWLVRENTHRFLTPLTAKALTPMVSEWVRSDEALNMKFEGWDGDCDHDGSNSLGWRVYCEDWGQIGGDPYTICAIRPAYMWHGK